MKKDEIKDFMIVETGYDDEKFLVLNGVLVNNELEGYALDDFDDELVNKEFRPASISKVYESVKLTLPFELDIENILEKQKPNVLWKRKPMEISLKYLESLEEEIREQFLEELDNFIYPIMFVE